MSKRFTDTEKWNKPWFRALGPLNKLGWNYLCDKCDIAGVINLDRDLASFQAGDTVDWDSLIGEAAGRICALECGKLWLVGFIEFQYGPEFPTEARLHQSVLKILGNYADSERVIKEYLKTYLSPKDKVKDKDKGSSRKGERGKPSKQISYTDVPVPEGFDSDEVRHAIRDWITYKSKRGEGYKDASFLGRKVAEFATAGPQAFIAAVNSSIGSNYVGLFPAKDINGKQQQSRIGSGQRYRPPSGTS